ncbi:zinc-binding protein [Candidatus Falkowbacteria bacterium HGW-Falkowbacteria-2]|uniref:Zinc-binding protein n=1 Tax=Candidatus Falkowbacteria bacterium HGW-Falkowbacteria-2 TaxID=2013769 RepID=A0A2N2E422_9BACT|nr:MAG: zinc-binding protein [Candidatus Falkowbacteria bacterium HGW-Falkowbacteria-2]
MRKKYIYLGVFVLLILAAVWAVTSSWEGKPKEDDDKIYVVASLFPWYDLAREIGGAKVGVSLPLPPGVEAHSFEPTPNDMINIGGASLFVYTGDYLEPWASDIISSLGNGAPSSSALGEGYATLEDDDEHEGEEADEEEEGHGVDPHIWLDPVIMSKAADRLAQKLGEVDSENTEYYNSRAEDYTARLAALDSDYREGLSSCELKDLIYAGHFAFGYLADRYGLQHEAAQGFSPDAESNPNRLIELTNLLREKQAEYVFTEATDSRNLAEALASEANVSILTLNSAHNLSREDLRAGLTYERIMRENLEKLKLGLKCQ